MSRLEVRYEMVDARKKMNLTQAQLAKLVGVSRAYIANIEAGRYAPSIDVAHRIANVLKGTIEQFFCGGNVRKMNEKKKQQPA